MPLCPTCDNRPFATKEALLQHVRTSSNPHPFCLACDRRFSSELAYNAHMAAKHPPTFDCLKCEKQYSSQFALEGHYRGHIDHPNCPVCGKGFYDNAALAAHARETHNDLWCNTCGLRFESVGTANEHYMMSPVHPNCGVCGVGFRDTDTLGKHARLHESNAKKGRAASPGVNGLGEADTPTLSPPPSKAISLHSPPTSVAPTAFSPMPTSLQPQQLPQPPLQPTTIHGFVSSPPSSFLGVGPPPARNGSTTAFGGTGFSPLIPKHSILNKDLRRVAAIDTTMRVDSPDISQMMNLQPSPLLNVQAPIFSPVGLPKPGKQIDEFWSSRENIQVQHNRLPRQSNLQAASSVSPPQPWNTTQGGLTGAGTIPSQQLVHFSSYRFQTMPPQHRDPGDSGDAATPIVKNLPPLNGSNHDASAILEPRLGATRQQYSFNPKLYPGSARYAATQPGPNNLSSPPITPTPPSSAGSSIDSTTTRPTQGPTFDPSFDFSFRQPPPSLLSLPLPFIPPTQQSSVIRTSPQSTAQAVRKENVPKANGLRRTTVVEEKPDKGSFHDDISMPSAVSTPRFASDVPLHDFGVKPGPGLHGDVMLPSPSDFSTDFSTVSSVSSSIARMPSPTLVNERRRDPSRSRSRAASSVRSDISSLNMPTYKITESSRRPSPVSPDVISPVGLAALPGISPLGPSPIDLDTSFDIPEAQHPLPDSIPPSPFVFGEPLDKQEEKAPIEQVGETKSRSTSILETHGDNDILFAPVREGAGEGFTDTPLGPSSPSSPQSFVTSHQEPLEEKLEILSVDANPNQSRSCSRVASPRSTPIQETAQEVGQLFEPNLVVKSPSPAPSRTSETPRAEDENVLPSQVTSPIHLSVGFNKPQRLIAPSLGVTPNISLASTAPSEGFGRTVSSSGLPPLHCRSCRRDTADDITATMCGHVFCNRCIVDAVIKTSRCPFCSTPTLLYCLFRLDLAT